MIVRPMWTHWRWLVVGATLTALAGCGADEGPRVATAQGGTPASSGAPPSSVPVAETDYDKALRYTRCLTQHGVLTPDPVEGEPLVTYNRITREEAQAGLNVLQLRRTAHEQCKQFLPATWPIKWDPEEIVRSRSYAECMRRNGIPMPVPDQHGMVREPTDDGWRSTPEYDAAVRRCRHLVDDPANDLPENK